jgi:hypothetical protein
LVQQPVRGAALTPNGFQRTRVHPRFREAHLQQSAARPAMVYRFVDRKTGTAPLLEADQLG